MKVVKEWENYLEAAVWKLDSVWKFVVVELFIYLHANASEDKMLELTFCNKTSEEMKEISQIFMTKF